MGGPSGFQTTRDHMRFVQWLMFHRSAGRRLDDNPIVVGGDCHDKPDQYARDHLDQRAGQPSDTRTDAGSERLRHAAAAGEFQPPRTETRTTARTNQRPQ